MKKIDWILGFVLMSTLFSCTKYNFDKTGISEGRFDGNMLEYMRAHSYDWDSTVLMVERAGLRDVFEGSEKITFFGPTNHSIRRYMLKKGIQQVKDMTPEFCKTTLLRHIMRGKMMREDFVHGIKPTGTALVGKGGSEYTLMGGNKIWAYTFKEPYNKVEGMGPVMLHVSSLDGGYVIEIASGDIEPDNGVVHSLGYNYTLGEM